MLKQVKGTKDIIADEYYKMRSLYDIAYRVAENYGFTSISTPIFEYTEVFTKNLGEDTDIITKEMYTFTDKGDKSITLRPEFTAAIARSFITNHLDQMPSPLKLIAHGPLFRYERPQQGRLRQFHQINCEVLGDPDAGADVEIISLAVNLLQALGIDDRVTLEINSLGDEQSYKSYREALTEYLSSYKDDLSADSQKRLITNPIRILDSKDARDKDVLKSAPKIYDYYNVSSDSFFSEVKKGLDVIGVDYIVNPYLVRGLDYYCHTTFEFTTAELGSQNAVIAGGRYDGLIKKMGGKDTPSIGFAGGIERLIALMSEIQPKKKDQIAIIAIDPEAVSKSMQLAHRLRQNDIKVKLMVRGALGKNMKKAENSSSVILIGTQELQKNTVTIKNMSTGEQQVVDYDAVLRSFTELIEPYL